MTITSRAEIRRHIAAYGVSLLAISDAAPCQKCGATPCAKHTEGEFSELEDGFVYSVGHHERQRPDLLVLCGPTPDEPAMNRDAMLARMQAAGALINYLVAHWDESPVLPGHRCHDHDGREYRVLDTPALVATAKDQMTVQAGVYYGTEDYALIVLMPESPFPSALDARH